MNMPVNMSFLRYALLADALASGATGLLAFAGAGILDTWLGLPANLLFYAGLSLIPYAALVAYLGTRPVISRPAVWAIVAYNVVWAIDSTVCWSADTCRRRRWAMPS